MPDWVFAELSGAAMRRDPNETELFKTEDAGEDEYAGTDALVREVIQNSMDAGSGDGPVRIRFALHEPHEAPPADRLGHYFGRLRPALEYREIPFDDDGAPKLDSGFLVCEDFGTCGLGGDVMRATDPREGHPHREDFFWFWRNIGRSGKTNEDLGRWGLGKTVYRAASRLGCMLGLTVRQQDDQRLLMGQAVLRIHRHDGAEYAPEGFWCRGCNDHGTPLPIEAPEQLERFSAEWALTRRDEPGLSVVVPFVAEALRTETMLRLVATNFFVPILRGDLIVDIAGAGLPGGSSEIRVDAGSIGEVCHALKWDGKIHQKQSCPPPVTLTERSLQVKDQAAETRLLGTERVPVLNEDSFEPETLERLRKQFAQEEVVPVRVRIHLPRRKEEGVEGELLVCLQRHGGTDRHESYFVREGMTIPRLNSKRSLRGVAGLVLVTSGPLASLLGDTEGPSHVSWDTSNDERANRVWKTWKGRVQFCTRIVDILVEQLQPPAKEVDFDLLSEFFSLDQAAPQKPNRKPGDYGRTGKPFVRPQPKPRWYRSSGMTGGFRLTQCPDLPVPVGAVLRVSVAYDIAGGDPLRNWSRFDFNFQERKKPTVYFAGKNLSVKPVEGNVLDVTVQDETFELKATGFDVHRDVFLRIDEIATPEDSEG